MTSTASDSKWVISARWDTVTCLSTLWLPLFFLLLWQGLESGGFRAREVSLAAFTAAISWPHFLTTFTFTFMDRDQRKFYRTRPILYYVVPAFIMIGCWAYSAAIGPVLLVTVWVLFGEHHVAAQNIGFASLYRGRNNEGEVDRKIDHLLWNSAWLTTVLFYVTRPIDGAGLVYLGRPTYSLPLPYRNELITGMLLLASLVFIVYLGRQVARWREGEEVSFPKLLFTVTTWPSFILVPLLVNDVAVAQIIRSGYHSVQYIGLVHLLNDRRVAARPNAAGDLLAWLVNRGPFVYLAIHAGVGVGLYWFTHVLTVQYAFGWDLYLRYLFFPGLVILHYYMDGLTWRFAEPHARETVVPFLKRRAPSGAISGAVGEAA
jgi:hypothetical protein